MALFYPQDAESLLNARETVVHIGQFSSLIKSRKFQSWLKNDDSRLVNLTERLISQLRKAALKYLDLRRPSLSRTSTLSNSVLMSKFSDECDSFVVQAIDEFNFKITKKELKFSFCQDEAVIEQLLKFFNSKPTFNSHLVSAKHDIFRGYSELRSFVEMRHTIMVPTSSSGFEKLLASKSEDYFMNGYAADMLAIDAGFARDGSLKGVWEKEEYCSTWAHLNENSKVTEKSYQYFPA